jgi:hypothetical protein
MLPLEKQRLQKLITLAPCHVIVLSGDMHFGHIQMDATTKTYDITSSGLTHWNFLVMFCEVHRYFKRLNRITELILVYSY